MPGWLQALAKRHRHPGRQRDARAGPRALLPAPAQPVAEHTWLAGIFVVFLPLAGSGAYRRGRLMPATPGAGRSRRWARDRGRARAVRGHGRRGAGRALQAEFGRPCATSPSRGGARPVPGAARALPGHPADQPHQVRRRAAGPGSPSPPRPSARSAGPRTRWPTRCAGPSSTR